MHRRRKLKRVVLPKIKLKVWTDKDGYVNYLFGEYGKEHCPTQYDDKGNYISGQPFYCWSNGTLYIPGYKFNSDFVKQLRNYLKYNVEHIHPADIAKT